MRDDHFGKWYSHKKTGSNFDRLVPLALPKVFTGVVFTGKSRPTRRIDPTRSRHSVGQLTSKATVGAAVTDLAERIKALKAAHPIDAAPTRTATRRIAIAAEMPVTARIRRRIEPALAIEPEDGLPPSSPAEPIIPKSSDEPPPPAEIHPLAEAVAAAPARPQTENRRQVAHGRRQDGRQLSLF